MTSNLTAFFGYATLVNYGILIIWFSVFWAFHGPLFRLHRHWFNLSAEAFDGFNYLGMAIYKILIFIFNVVPWIVLSRMF
jgi:hypothetical protein